MASTTALIVAAGRGTRASRGLPKQYVPLAGRPVLARAIEAFARSSRIGRIVVAIHPDDLALFEKCCPAHAKMVAPVIGGESRAETVLNGLRSLQENPPQHVLIHDGARPFATAGLIDRVLAALDDAEGAVPTLPAVDAMRRVADGLLGEPVSRQGVRRAQTPQGFSYDVLRPIMEEAALAGTLSSLGDEAQALIAAGRRVASVEGEPLNFKLTIPEDFDMAERMLATPDVRTGQGYDVHAFTEGDRVILCGVEIPHGRGLLGHSDADVGLHTITDALLGTMAEGDIGRHFPPSDPTWRGTDSAVFLRRAVEIVGERGFAIGNIDLTLICEEPKITPHAPAMRERVAEICGIGPDRVSVKATTSEGLGFTGRREGIAAMAVATVVRVP